MESNALVVVVDDDPTLREIVALGLTQAGFAVQSFASASDALSATFEQPPQALVADLMMPDVDGFELCHAARSHPAYCNAKIVVVSAKTYETDRQAALDAGADAFLPKPVDAALLSRTLRRLLSDRIHIGFWGVRGTLPAPSASAVRYGGNTSCVSIELPRGQRFVLDAGSGIQGLGREWMKEKRRQTAAILITHPHWDHINALPFFAPLYVPGNQFRICGPAQPGASMRDLVAAQMDGRFFPITPREFASDITYTDLRQGNYQILDTNVSTFLLMHPGTCLGYRIRYGDRTIAYITDQELSAPGLPGYSASYVDTLARFLSGADVLITDTTYTDAEYPSRVGWGHSSVSQVADLAHRAGVKHLCLVHHDPTQTDDDIDAKLADCQAVLQRLGATLRVSAPAEGTVLKL